MTEQKQATKRQQDRKKYHKPSLIEFGKVKALTAGGSMYANEMADPGARGFKP